MEEAVKVLDFETAALIRDEIYALESLGGKKKKTKNGKGGTKLSTK
jgi:protein-arginine kinase activator protein McsA